MAAVESQNKRVENFLRLENILRLKNALWRWGKIKRWGGDKFANLSYFDDDGVRFVGRNDVLLRQHIVNSFF